MPKATNEVTTEATTQPKEYKVLLYWKGGGMLTIPLQTGTVTLYPGYNTIMNTDMVDCYSLCRNLFDGNMMHFYGESPVEAEDGSVKFTESVTLQKMTDKNLDKVIKDTVNPKTLRDLSDPKWISKTYLVQAQALVKAQMDEISQYEGVPQKSQEDIEE